MSLPQLLMIFSKLIRKYNQTETINNKNIYEVISKEIIKTFEDYLRKNFFILTIKDAFLVYNTI